ncbi:MAG TPA: hypothetical protein VKV03_19785 [Candidatus Binataceae bacterium]|nr:hypothetical protein [Candidatus Binataceae bacterium]
MGHASAFDIAHHSVATGALFGFLQGYIVCEGEGLPAEVFTGAIKGLLPLESSKDKGIDSGIAQAEHDLIEKAINAGQGQADFAYLYEVLRKK